MVEILHPIVQFMQPFLVPLCGLFAWGMVLLAAWSLWTALRDTAIQTRKMHRIPCSECRFFTHHYHLKCTIHPSTALTEEAIDCLDYEKD